jgi:hypothetical protein
MVAALRLSSAETMKLPREAAIARAKVTDYLLVRQSRGDKSAFLESVGYSLINPGQLIADLHRLAGETEATQVDENKFGRYYEVVGTLCGPAGVRLRVRTIWMTEHLSGYTKFITLIPLGAFQR